MKAMLGRSFLLSALLAGSIGSGEAAALDPEGMRPQRDRAGAGIQLAQAGDIEVYYDRQGNRVMVDAWSGEVIAIERPREVAQFAINTCCQCGFRQPGPNCGRHVGRSGAGRHVPDGSVG